MIEEALIIIIKIFTKIKYFFMYNLNIYKRIVSLVYISEDEPRVK